MSSLLEKARNLRIVLQDFHSGTPTLSFDRERADMFVRMARDLEDACTEDRLNQPRLVSGAKPKHTTCATCDATIAYMPEHAKRSPSMGDEVGDLWVKCPRPGCKGDGLAR